MSNIAEGFERGSRAEFAQCLVIAKASCGEVRSLLYVALDEKWLQPEEFERLLRQTEEVSRIISGLRAAVIRQRTPAPHEAEANPSLSPFNFHLSTEFRRNSP
jgi:hypothetical protein